MRERERLPERSDIFAFNHKPSEVNYGGHAHFYQAAFPPPTDGSAAFEEKIFLTVKRFTEIIQEHGPGTALVFSLPQPELVDVFFDQWCETSQLQLPAFQNWVNHELAELTESYRRLRLNALQQERATGIERLNYLVLLAISSVVAGIIAEFFEKQIDRLGRLATTARLSLGRSLALVFRAVEDEEGMRRMRRQKLGHEDLEEECDRLLNPFIFAFLDSADSGLVDEVLAAANPYQVSQGLRARIMAFLGQTVVKGKSFEARNLKRTLAEPTSIARILQNRRERGKIMAFLRRQRDLRVQIVLENARTRLRQDLREYLRTSLAAGEIAAYVSNEKQLSEILQRSAVRKRFLKKLAGKNLPQAEAVRTTLRDGLKRLRRARRRWFFTMSKREVGQEFNTLMGRLSRFLAQAEDFQIIRARYGQDTNKALDWQGMRIWRAFDLKANGHDRNVKDPVVLERMYELRQVEIQNGFDEGNLFLCRDAGDIYPLSAQRRSRVFFMFADLRNSTETTMKLTKDTASFLAPYLTAVNSCATACEGQRIYFAGDGFAAFFLQAKEAVRAAYSVTARFQKLRTVSAERHVRKAKEIFQATTELKLDLRHPERLRQHLARLERQALAPEVQDFLTEMAAQEAQEIPETVMRKLLAKVSAAYSMPRVDIGIALTCGELFYALVGEEQEEKIPIVISPHLTQAARLSGSSDLVKNYIETHFPESFPFSVYTWDKKLYNRGIAATEEIFQQLQNTVGLEPLKIADERLSGETLFGYRDESLKRRIILRENAEPVFLKGIDKPCRVYEIATLGSLPDKLFNEG